MVPPNLGKLPNGFREGPQGFRSQAVLFVEVRPLV